MEDQKNEAEGDVISDFSHFKIRNEVNKKMTDFSPGARRKFSRQLNIFLERSEPGGAFSHPAYSEKRIQSTSEGKNSFFLPNEESDSKTWRSCSLKCGLTILLVFWLISLLIYNIVSDLLGRSEFWSFMEQLKINGKIFIIENKANISDSF